jgi:carbamoyl-phosphate synthase large subunit
VTTTPSVLVTSAGRRVSLVRSFQSAVEQLGIRARVLAGDASELSAARRVADEDVTLPKCTDAGFIDELLRVCAEADIGLVVPTIDTELSFLADAREQFAEQGTYVLVPSPEVVRVSSDKRATNQFLRDEGLPAPRQWAPPCTFEATEDAFPLIAKPAAGSASLGVRLVHTAAEVAVLPTDYVVETLAPGAEFTSDVYVDRTGQCVAVVVRERLETRAGEVSKGATRRIPALESLAHRTVAALKVSGCVLTLQAFVTRDLQSASLIEINARFGGGYPLSHRAGANFPLWLIREHILGLPHGGTNEWADNLLMLRYDDAVYVEDVGSP